MDTNQKSKGTQPRRKTAAQSGKAPASNAQRRSTAPTTAQRRKTVQTQSRTAQTNSIPRKSDSLTDTRRRTSRNAQGLMSKLRNVFGKSTSRDKREEAARAARVKAMRQEVADKEKEAPSNRRKISKPQIPTQPIVYTQPKTFNAHRLMIQLMSVLAVVLALIMGMSVFFKVEVIEVSGANVYTEWAVRQASGIEVGDSLLTFSRARAGGKIYAELTYVDHVRFGIKLPNTVIIDIDELDVVYAIESSDGTTYLMSSQGKIVEQTDGSNADNYTKIEGVTLRDPIVGEQARAAEEVVATTATEEGGATEGTTPVYVTTNAARLATALTILQSLERNGIVGEAASVDVGDLDHIGLMYGTRYEVNLGNSDKIDYKIAAMRDTINKLADYQTGELDVSFTIREDAVVYTPFS